MNNYDKLIKIINKEIISLKELHQIMNDELISEILANNSNKKHENLPKYDVKLTNGELYSVYVKR